MKKGYWVVAYKSLLDESAVKARSRPSCYLRRGRRRAATRALQNSFSRSTSETGMTATSSFISTLATLALAVASLLGTCWLLMATSLLVRDRRRAHFSKNRGGASVDS